MGKSLKHGSSEQVQARNPEAEEAGRFREPLESGGCASSQAPASKDRQPLARLPGPEQSPSQPAWSPPTPSPTKHESGYNPRVFIVFEHSAGLRNMGPQDEGRTRSGGSLDGYLRGDGLPSLPTPRNIVGPDLVQALASHGHRLPGGEREAPRHHAGPGRQLCSQLVLQQWELRERAAELGGQGPQALHSPGGPKPQQQTPWGVAGTSQQGWQPRTYHARGQEHRHVAAVPQAHLPEEESPQRGTGLVGTG